MNNKKKKILLILAIIFSGSLLGLGALFLINNDIITSQEKVKHNNKASSKEGFSFLKPITKDINESGVFEKLTSQQESESQRRFEEDNLINIVLLGIDRRSKTELGFRTDTMIIVSANPETNKVLLISIPRDLWVEGNRVNAAMTLGGWEQLKASLDEITGMNIENFVYTDFEDFVWVVDAMGGVPVNVERTFTDSNYPVDATLGYQTVTFTQGPELLTGERALIYSRSRKGNNGEGSDWMRMRRQHLILKGMLEAIVQPKSLFNPMVVENAYNMVTNGRMVTNLSVEDAKYLWDFYKDKDDYEIISVYLDQEFLYNPPLSEYGGAWVLVPQGKDYTAFHSYINNLLLGIEQSDPTIEVGTTIQSN